MKAGDSVSIHFTIENPGKSDINFLSAEFPAEPEIIIADKKDLFEAEGHLINNMPVLHHGEKIDNEIKFIVPAIVPGNYKLGLGFSTIFGPTLNSPMTKNNHA